MRVLGISGSLRRESHNTRLLKAAAGLLPAGSELELFGGLAEIPPFSEDDEHAPPPAVIALKDAIASADAVLFATPEYNGSVPGQLKNALDWVSRPRASTPLAGKPVAVVGASMGIFGAVWAQAELRKVLSTIGARVLERDLPVAQAHETLAPDGLPTDPGAREALREILAELTELAEPLTIAA
jgi:chromate reductase